MIGQKLYGWVLVLLAFVLPIVRLGYPLFLLGALLVGVFCWWQNKQSFFQFFKDCFDLKSSAFVFGIGFLIYLSYLISGLWSDNLVEWGRQLELKSSFIYFPLLLALHPKVGEWRHRIFDGLTVGVVINAILCYIRAFIRSEYDFELFYFSYAELSYFFHPSYASLFGVFALAFQLWRFLADQPKYQKILRGISILFLMLFVVMLSSKAGVISEIVVLIVFLFFLVWKKRNWKLAIFGGIFLSAWLFVGYNNLSVMTQRVNTLKYSVTHKSQSDNGHSASGNSRMVMWKTGWGLIKTAPVLGNGAGDVRDLAEQEINILGVDRVKGKRYNFHNQYIETWASVGVFGLLLLIALLFFAAIPRRKFQFFWLVVALVLAFNILVESMLERQAGILFFSWLLAVLGHSFRKKLEVD